VAFLISKVPTGDCIDISTIRGGKSN